MTIGNLQLNWILIQNEIFNTINVIWLVMLLIILCKIKNDIFYRQQNTNTLKEHIIKTKYI